MSVKRAREKSVLSKQDIAVRRRALNQKKMKHTGTGRRAIFGVFVLAFSVLAFLSVATFDAHDRVGPGFRNAIGPVGHALAEGLRGLLGLCAFVVPFVGFYASAILFVGDRDKKRWPQVLSFALLLLSGAVLAQLIFKEDASWAHAPGGLVGRQLGGLLTALFSTVGTVVLVSAIAATAAIVGTQFAFLRLCAWAWEKGLVLADRAHVWGLAWWEKQKVKAEERRVAAEKSREEEAAFLADLEAEEAELSELEAAAAEADAIVEENNRTQAEKEALRAAELAEKERQRLEKERATIEVAAARLAKEAIRTAQLKEKEARKAQPAALAGALLAEKTAAVQSPVSEAPAPAQPVVPGADPAWAMSLGAPLHAAPAPVPGVPSQPPPPRRPTIVEPPALPPVTDAAVAMTSLAAAELGDTPLMDTLGPVGASATGVQGSTTALATMGATALARMPLIVEPKAPPKPTKRSNTEQFEFADGRTSFGVPPLDLLEMSHKERKVLDKEAFLVTAERLTAKLRDFGIDGEVVEIRPGPVVTMYEFKPAPGVKISKIASLSDDLAMAMEAMRVRIVAPIPGKGVVGIEVPNRERETVFLKEVAEQDAFQKSASRLTMCLGKDIEGMPYILDLSKAPHLLMAGTTGSGKSVSVNSMIMSILLKSTPEEVRFIMVDPKMLELSVYEGIPHLLLPVVTDPRKAAVALQWAVEEMTRRYKLLSEAGVRNITGYNQMIEQEQKTRAANRQTVDARPTVIKPRAEKPAEAVKADAPKSDATLESAPTADASAEPKPEAPKKKRRMLIVDVASEEQQAQAANPSSEDASAPSSLELGVAAPRDELEDPREQIEGVVPELSASELAAEIRVEEAHLEPTEQEAQALADAAAAAEAEADAAPAERKKLPYIVVIIDELADLMMVASKEVETSIARLAQMARAAGIHLMVATQRPSTDVVTGIIKANFPTRISFMLRSKPDSMTILGTVGAEALLGMGDMLIMPPTSAHMQRVHGCYVSETEIKKVVDHLRSQGKPVYDESILEVKDEGEDGDGGGEDELADELYDQAVAIVSEMRTVSISVLQRKMRIGYNRAARMIERMERDGMVGAADGAKPREVLVRPVGQMPGAGAMS
jgi:S-DNA-T family DNA segregation ATPase FtsK/SpoIIIE